MSQEFILLWTYSIGIGLLAILYGLLLSLGIERQPKELFEEVKSEAQKIRKAKSKFFNPLIAFSAFLVLIFYLLTLPKEKPFSPGQSMGLGFLIGGLLTIGVSLLVSKLTDLGNLQIGTALPQGFPKAYNAVVNSSLALTMIILGTALSGISITFYLFLGFPTAALLGYALGVCLVMFFSRLGLSIYSKAVDSTERELNKPEIIAPLGGHIGQGLPMDIFALFTIALATAIVLAILHLPQAYTLGKLWWVFPIAVFGISILALFFGTRFLSLGKTINSPATALRISIVATIIFSGLFVFLISWKLINNLSLFYTVASGLVSGALVLWLVSLVSSSPKASLYPPLGIEAAIIIILLALGLMVFSFNLLAGYGIALCLLGILSFAGLTIILNLFGLHVHEVESLMIKASPKSSEAQNNLQALKETSQLYHRLASGFTSFSALLLTAVLFRIFLEKYARGGEVTLSLWSHQVFIGLLLGALLPFLFSTLNLRAMEGIYRLAKRRLSSPSPDFEACIKLSRARVLGQVALVGFLSLAIPTLLLLFWGIKGAAGFLVGLIAAQAFLLLMFFLACGAYTEREDTPIHQLAKSALNPIILGMSLVLIQLGHLLQPYIPMLKRIHKIYVVIGTIVVAIILTLVSAFRRLLEEYETTNKHEKF